MNTAMSIIKTSRDPDNFPFSILSIKFRDWFNLFYDHVVNGIIKSTS